MTQQAFRVVMLAAVVPCMWPAPARAQGFGPGFHVSAGGDLNCPGGQTVSQPDPPAALGPLVVPCTSGQGIAAAEAGAGTLRALGRSEHACCGTASGGNGSARIEIASVVISGPDAPGVPISLNFRLRGTLAGNASFGQAGVFLFIALQGFNANLQSTSQIEMNEFGIFSQTGVFAPLALGFPNAAIDQAFVTHTVNVAPNQPLTLRLQLGAASAMAGAGATETDFFSGSNGFAFPDDVPVFNLPAGYTVDIPELGIFNNRVGRNSAPVANAGPDQTVDTALSSAAVVLDGTASSDPDGDLHTFVWDGPFGTVSGPTPTVTLPPGTHVVTLTVSDGTATATDSVTIVVHSTVGPTIQCPGGGNRFFMCLDRTVCAEALSPAGGRADFAAFATDPVDPNPIITYSQGPGTIFPLGTTPVTATVTTASGSASCSFNVWVHDFTPPRIFPLHLATDYEPFDQQWMNIGSAPYTLGETLNIDGSDIGHRQRFLFKYFPDLLIGDLSLEISLYIDPGSITFVTEHANVEVFISEGRRTNEYGIPFNRGSFGNWIRVAAILKNDERRLAFVTASGFSAGIPFDWGTGLKSFTLRRSGITGEATIEADGQTDTVRPLDIFGVSGGPLAFLEFDYLPYFGFKVDNPSFFASARVAFGPMGDTTVEATSAEGAVFTFPAAADGADPAPRVDCSHPSGSVFPLGLTGVDCMLTDANGNSTIESFVVRVVDRTAPTLSVPADITAVATSPSGAVVTYALPTATDAVDPAPAVSCVPASGHVFPIGTTVVSCQATDRWGNSASESFSVTVGDNDNHAPLADAGPDQTVEATSAAGALVTLNASASADPDGDPLDFRWAGAFGTASGAAPTVNLPLGTSLVSLTVDDGRAIATDGVSITVRDSTAPAIACPANINRSAASASGAIVAFPAATVTDAVDPTPLLTYSQASATLFPIGTTTVNVTAVDAAANSSQCSFLISVVNHDPDAQPDTVAVVEDSAPSAIQVLANDSDADGNPLIITAVGAPAHGTTAFSAGSVAYTPAPDYFGPDSFTYTVSDGIGGTALGTVSVSVTNVNDSPVAASESYSATEDTPLTVGVSGVLANDTDVDGNALTAILVTGAAHGSLTLNPNGSVTYVPTTNFAGSDGFTYAARDTFGAVSAATSVSITVNSVNDAPVNSVPGLQATATSLPLLFSSNSGNSISIADVDAGTNPLAVALLATNGTVTLSGTAGLTFITGDGSADVGMTFLGEAARINAALEGMRFNPVPGFSGAASLRVTTSDQGYTGTGGPLSDTDTMPITVGSSAAADLSITMTDAPDRAAVNAELRYAIDVRNNGPYQATTVTLIDALPADVAFVSAAASQGTCTFLSVSRLVQCNLGSMANNGTAFVTLLVRPTARRKITNQAAIGANQSDPSLVNNTATIQTMVR